MFSLQHTEHDWNYRAEVTDKASKMIKNGSFWPRGKMLGGSSSMNAMVYLRGFPYDFDEWAAMGNEGWDYATVLEYFKKSEGNQAQDMIKYDKFHSATGPLKVDYYHSGEGTRFIFLGAAGEAGHFLLHDFNGDDRVGYAYVQGTVANGERQSTAKAYLVPAASRKNLHVIKHAHVVDLEMEAGKVTGVNFSYNATKTFVAKAKKEVVLSAGAIGTPQILMLSGIGPKAHLEQVKIPVVQDLPVGQNLEDHVYVPMFFTFKKLINTVDAEILSDQLFMYLMNRMGPFASVGSLDLVGFVDSKNVKGTKPDIEYHHLSYERKSPVFLFFLRAIGYDDMVIKTLMEVNEKSHVSVAWVVLINPKSKGEIVLRSNEAAEKPKIIPNYFEEQEDMDTMIRGIKFYADFEKSETFKDNEGELIKLNLPDCNMFEYKSNDYWQCYARMMSSTLYHPVGTARMGPAADKNSVVDSHLKVKGVSGLRVADASVMPKIVSVNTNAATIMIGERCADFIKDQWMTKKDKNEL